MAIQQSLNPQTSDAKRTQVRNLMLLLLAVAFFGATTGIYDTTFNNYVSETFNPPANARGALELPREFPGFLVAISAGLLAKYRHNRIAGLTTILTALGFIGLGYFSPTYSAMVLWMVVWSIGVHVYMPFESSLALATAQDGQGGKRLGQLEGVKTAAVVAGATIVWLGTDYLHLNFRQFFTITAITSLLAALTYFCIDVPPIERSNAKRRFLFDRHYSLYYLLSVLYGARKQIFMTFGPWLLIKVLGEPASTIAKLWIVAAVLGIIFRPYLGRLIDRTGERIVLMADAILVFFICFGYGYAPTMGWGVWGVRLLYACFVLDQLLVATTMARTMYLYNILKKKEDLTPTLSMGISIDHAVSMCAPLFAGLIWDKFGYTTVFVGAAGITLLNLIATYFIPSGRYRPSQT